MSRRAALPGLAGQGRAVRGMLVSVFLVAVALILSQQAPASIVQSMGDPSLPNISGLDKPEQGEAGAFRWSNGPVAIDLQPLGYPLYTKLTVQGVRPEGEAEARMFISSEGKSLGAFTLPRNMEAIEVKLPAGALLPINPRLDITTTLFQVKGDRRILGAVFYKVEQRSGPGPSLPSLWPTLWLLVSALLTYVAVYVIGRRVRYALAIALAWGLAIGLLNAVARPWLVFYSLYSVVPPLVVLLILPWLRALFTRKGSATGTQTSLQRPKETVLTEYPWLISSFVIASSLLTLAWHLLARFVPEGKTPRDNLAWGVSFFGALPAPLQLLGVAVVLGSMLWAWLAPFHTHSVHAEADARAAASPTYEEGATTSSRRQPADVRFLLTRHAGWVAAIAGLIVYSLLPAQYSEGDSSEFDRKIPAGAIWRERELLDFYLKAKLWLLLRGWLPKPSQVYVVVANVAGGLYAGGAVLLGKALGRTTRERWVIAAAMLTIGNVLLFFGYVESYALVNLVSLFVLWACWQYTRGAVTFGTVGALATLAPLLHGSALWWGPMVVAAWVLRARSLPREGRWRQAIREGAQGVGVGAAMSLLMVSVAAIDGYDFEQLRVGLASLGGVDGRTMLPLFTTVTPQEHYAFFSWPHLGAIIQEQLLTAPLALLTLLILLVTAWPGVKQLARATPSLVTLAVGAASMFFYTVTWNPDLGPRDDWDLLSLAALPLTLLAIYLLTRLPPGVPRRLALTAYISVSAVHTAAWVFLHVAGIGY